MTEKYKRIQNVEEKIHSVKLPFNSWKVFFLIDNEVTAPQISEYLDEDLSVVKTGLERLVKEGLVESVAGGEAEQDLPDEGLADDQAEPDISMDFEESEAIVETQMEEDDLASFGGEIDEDLPEIGSDTSFEDESLLAEDMPDFTEDLISVVEEEEQDQPEDDESLDELISEDLEIDEEIQVDFETGETEEELQIEIDGVDEEKDLEFDVSNLDVDFAEQPAPAQEKPAVKPKEEKTGSKTILVIDDSIVIRKMVEIALEDENYNLATAVSGKDGLALIDEKNPDLIILDLMLPDINGIDLLKTVKASKGIPVIMLSGKDSPQMVEKARAEGADAFLPKPFKDDELVEKIKELVK